MKIIDEKGRLFGKLNIIDLLVILLIAAIAVAAVMKFTGADTANDHYDASLNRNIEYTVICRVVYNPIVAEAKKEVGNQLMAGGELVEGCFIKAVDVEPHYDTYVDNEGKMQKQLSEDYSDVVFTIAGEAPFVNNAYKVGTQEVRVARSHIVKTLTFEMTGTVTTLTEVEG